MSGVIIFSELTVTSQQLSDKPDIDVEEQLHTSSVAFRYVDHVAVRLNRLRWWATTLHVVHILHKVSESVSTARALAFGGDDGGQSRHEVGQQQASE